MMGDTKPAMLSPEWVKRWWMGERYACPPHLEAPLASALADRQYEEGRFLAVMGFILALASLVIDAVIVPERFWEIAAVRLAPTIPLQLLALAMPRERLIWQKLFIGLSLCVFATSLVYASQLAPPGAALALALGPIILLGTAVPLLPFSKPQLALFVAGFVIPVSAATMQAGFSPDFTQTLEMALLIVAFGAAVIGLRLRRLEQQRALATLLAESRLKELENSNERLRQLSMQDPLTDLANRRWVETAFARDYALSREEVPGYPCLFLLDLDHFKAFNDRWGHGAGDDCLLAVAGVLQHVASTHGGIAARFGGEEFVLLLRIEDLAQSQVIAEQIRVAVERIEIRSDIAGLTATCTTSIGIAIHEESSAPELSDLLKRADEALYQAKNDGRNRTSIAA